MWLRLFLKLKELLILCDFEEVKAKSSSVDRDIFVQLMEALKDFAQSQAEAAEPNLELSSKEVNGFSFALKTPAQRAFYGPNLYLKYNGHEVLGSELIEKPWKTNAEELKGETGNSVMHRRRLISEMLEKSERQNPGLKVSY